MRRGCKKICAGSFLLALSLAWARASSATPDFPAVVVQYLGLDAGITIDPPQGCKLCHPTDSGGTSLAPFGTLVLQDGAMPYDEASLTQALAEIELDDPQLIADIRAGRDPNDDTGSADVHTPEYGCALGERAPGEPLPIVAVASVALLAWTRRRGGFEGARP